MSNEPGISIDEEISDLRHKVFHNQRMEEEREISDDKYAIKLVEKIVFGMLATAGGAIVLALMALVLRKGVN